VIVECGVGELELAGYVGVTESVETTYLDQVLRHVQYPVRRVSALLLRLGHPAILTDHSGVQIVT